ncbi:hypothetical protein [Streptomyces sp. HUAS TT3]|uniref:hypothetical protein n=1 Tax=Streptomyces sp. HUAS TT3 TaxID=3447510 RepID=UPI003F655238
MPEPQEQPPGPEPGPGPARGSPVPPSEAEPGAQAAGPGTGSGSLLEKAAYVTAPATVVLGLLYYFGSTYTDAYYAYFGIPASDLQLSLQTYVVKSPDAVFFPLWLLLICGLVVLLVLGSVGRALAVPGREALRRRVTGCLLALGLLLVLAGFPAYFMERRLPQLPSGWMRDFLPCLVVALGATLAFFAVQMHLGRSRDGELHKGARMGDRLWLVGGTLLIGLLAMSLFFAMARYAAQAGWADAKSLASSDYLDSPRVVVHSKVRIPHHLKAIVVDDQGAGAAPYRYQYRGFRLLTKSPSRFYVVSYAVSDGAPVVLALPDDDTVRVEISP